MSAFSFFQVRSFSFCNSNILSLKKLHRIRIARNRSFGNGAGFALSGMTSAPSHYYFDGSNYIAALWKVCVKTDLSAVVGQNSYASSVYITGGSVYVAGYYYDGSSYIASVWKDGVRTDLAAAGYPVEAFSVYVVGDNVYAAGLYNDGSGAAAVTWKNGVMTVLPAVAGKPAMAFSIYVSAE